MLLTLITLVMLVYVVGDWTVNYMNVNGLLKVWHKEAPISLYTKIANGMDPINMDIKKMDVDYMDIAKWSW